MEKSIFKFEIVDPVRLNIVSESRGDTRRGS